MASTILDQVATTKISINSHVQGHFISEHQLAALRRLLVREHSTDSEPAYDTDEAELDNLREEIEQLQRRLRRCTISRERVELNHQIGQAQSRAARLERALRDD